MEPITGIVQRGKKLARTLGFPTANIPCTVDLPEGVYAANTVISSEPQKEWASLAYIKDDVLEVFLIDANIDLYDREITVVLTKFVRAPVPYTTAEAMRDQIQKDLLGLLNSDKRPKL